MVVATHPARCACCRRDGRARVFRRDLTSAETHLDIVADTEALDETKRLLAAEILRVQRIGARARRRGRRIDLPVTRRMLELLVALRDHGRRAAMLEAKSLGVPLDARAFAPELDTAGMDRPIGKLLEELSRLSTRLESKARTIEGRGVSLGIEDVRAGMLARLAETPGALNAAGLVVSTTLATGLADVFSANADAFGGWQYSAVMDGGTCPTCEALDGTVYATWDDIQEVLPDGGPNPDCDGGDRCRCRAVGLPPEGTQTTIPEPPPAEPPAATPFSSDAYAQAFDTGTAQDMAGVIGYDRDGLVLEHARADHDAVMAAGREIHDEVMARVAELDPTRTSTWADLQRAKAEEVRAIEGVAKAEAAAAKYGPDDITFVIGLADSRENLRLATEARALLEAGPRHYVTVGQVRRIEREVLEARGVTFADGNALEAAMPAASPRPGVYAQAEASDLAAVKSAATSYPASWVEASNAAELRVMRHVEAGVQRPHYSPTENLLATTEGHAANAATSGGNEVMVHELGHRMESTIPEVVRAERAFYEWRARGGSWTGVREAEQQLWTGGDEYSIFDEWRERYTGKAYPESRDHGYLGSYEILSQAMGAAYGRNPERLLDRETLRLAMRGRATIREDRELMRWLFGLLVHVKPL